MLDFLEMSTVFHRRTLLEEPNVFCSELEDLFGAGALGIENLIVERFYEKINIAYVRVREKSFVDYINEAVEASIE